MSYDPLSAPGPGRNQDHVASYWRDTAPMETDDGTLQTDTDADVVIVGGGYTGLSAAYHLGHLHGVKAVVLEANRPGWGCSGRNGGFVSPAVGRLKAFELIERFGADMARNIFSVGLESVALVQSLINTGEIDCDKTPPGFLQVAHRPNRLSALENLHKLYRNVFDFDTELLSAYDLRQKYFAGEEAFGALRDPISFGVHPLKLANGLLRMARATGAQVFSGSPVVRWKHDGSGIVVTTPTGSVSASSLLIATNGYSTESLFPMVKHRILPVLSSIIVTRPLTEYELAESGFSTQTIMVDTRVIRPYYRKLADNRIMFGSRGALRESESGDKVTATRLLRLLTRKFPALRGITAEFIWGGWVNVTRDYLPRVHRSAEKPNVIYAMGYNGSGVATSIQSGKWSASMLAGDGGDVPAPLAPELVPFPAPSLRRLGQAALVSWYRIRDAI